MPHPPPYLKTTACATFGSCEDSHDPLFSVRAGLNVEDVLIHLTILLRSAYATNEQACQVVDNETRHLLWSTRTAVEMAQGLVQALLGGMETDRSRPELR
ncbi:DUF3077 domain-containing protein [Pseudomonas laurentiana]|uniref:DUF3077 domain-containing protein n=1 Tax=Pseudomonas laurentiana TaxID=2364649 RepID=A0A6I5RKP7_9PSED|nr:DUF3077 domain-containing protein [Pseudomonas laurentiana]